MAQPTTPRAAAARTNRIAGPTATGSAAPLSHPGRPVAAGGAFARVRQARSSTTNLLGRWLSHPQASLYLVIVSAGLLITLGVVMVLSSSSVYAMSNVGDSYYFFKRQLGFALVGLIAAFLVARATPEQLRRVSLFAMFAALGLLILTYTPLGVKVNGNTNWIEFGTSLLRIQPSEFAKVAMIVWGAAVLDTKQKVLDQPRHLLFPFLPVWLLVLALVIFRGDMGTTVIMGGIMVAVLFAVGAPLRILGSMAVFAVVGMAAMTLQSSNRMRRMLAFLNPTADVEGANMQATVGVLALATGGWWGVGLGASRQKWGSLPEAHTDFIFAVIGEELGLIGSLLVLGLFLLLGYAGLRIALRSDILMCRLMAAGITTWFMFQALVNVAVVLRLLPVLGVPLPMLSYGGSALLANMIALGVLCSCARQEPAARALREAAKAAPAPRVTAVVGSRH
ncbi:putative lipid II flippase FtsW [Granulicoccus phenolivorans]|uniref:putative lipid II flippase FtsW n=1 Tax=Granulicoccus phenolivorans TaxID=266854 RepID=UPI0003F843E8|nr:putative lipid II flippase FtsW [Granulicoccus phenolivorans]